MEITEQQYRLIEDCLPKHFGRWHTIYTRWSRWSKAGVLDRVFERLQHVQACAIR